ncbi:MAG TPA: N-acetylmuramidase domain-containing protein [Bryobacteraceae bacterium]|nr:N-acetylmuramidase domain-containing protein [Bryobacteraceae bacterium]
MELLVGPAFEEVILTRNDQSWKSHPLDPVQKIQIGLRCPEEQRAIVAIYNRLGGLIRKVAAKHDVKCSHVIAVWVAQGGWRPFRPQRAPIRFNVHRFFDVWGKRCRADFDLYFRFGGHNLQPGQPWDNHEYRPEGRGAFVSVHHNPNSEYEALMLARMLAGDEAALRCLNIGGPLIPVDDFTPLGYESSSAMYKSMQESELAHVLTFFDLCRLKQAPKSGLLLQYLRLGDWLNFCRHYDQPSELDPCAERMRQVVSRCESMLPKD